MKDSKVILLAMAVATIAIVAGGCSRGAKPGDQSTPTLAYKALYEAVKKKDSEGIKKVLSKGTLEMMETYAGMQKKTLNEVVENGLTETTFSPTLPATRNEKITKDLAILEVKNEKTGTWESLPFAKEDGNWKLAIDTYFKGTMSPTGPTNPENPGQLPPDTKQATPGGSPMGTPPNGKPNLSKPVMPGAVPPGTPQVAPTPNAKPSVKSQPGKEIKPPTR